MFFCCIGTAPTAIYTEGVVGSVRCVEGTGLYDPTELGMREKMTAAKELLDRTGLVKTEKMQVESTGGVMLMPVKNVQAEDE